MFLKLFDDRREFIFAPAGSYVLRAIDIPCFDMKEDRSLRLATDEEIASDADAARAVDRSLEGRWLAFRAVDELPADTAVTISISRDGARRSTTILVTTEVTFVALTDEMIDWYLATGEANGKAGAYGIQGAAGAFVERVNGSVTNVIGLPLAETLAALGIALAT